MFSYAYIWKKVFYRKNEQKIEYFEYFEMAAMSSTWKAGTNKVNLVQYRQEIGC